MKQIEIREFLEASGRSPFGRWFEGLNAVAAARVTIALGGSAKKRQSAAIAAAQAAWVAYKRRKGGME